ncbi:multicopper oxidase domain-containing protein [Thiohalobacter sp. IOR34]|uniref:multicopper oxidase domain-containing protein n=1 Tax=Thiohalobacter sp. IOR34 TaxID=3057176 RepID=UPI0025AFC14E|nr:multicopper oxidase domain-containing protein [Thiohalobacter sp. IOR34]WJW76372.1 multicopper oxidase domain-containing protein [Thiohalobacter sp. IOR34]
MKRRDFLKASLGGSAFAFTGLTLLPQRQALAATLDVQLIAEVTSKTLVDGNSVPVWQFRDPNGSGPGVLGSGLVVKEGDTVNITLSNNLDRAINFVIPGVLSGTAAVAPGSSRSYSFTAPAAGSYFYTDDVNGEIGRAMGLAGPLVVMPADGSNSLYSGGPAFDRQYTLVLHEMDDRLNAAVGNGGSYDMANYEPNYYFVNGLSYPNTASDSDTLVAMNVGENVAIRFINTGCISYPQHFHGYHVKVISRNRVLETTVIDKDTTQVERGMCTDVILPVAQPGAYPLHTHYVPGVTANGVYVYPYGGALIVLAAS